MFVTQKYKDDQNIKVDDRNQFGNLKNIICIYILYNKVKLQMNYGE